MFEALLDKYKEIVKSKELKSLLYYLFYEKLTSDDYRIKRKFVDKIIDIISIQDLNEIIKFSSFLSEAVENKDKNILIKVINKLSNQDLVKVLSNTGGIKALEITIEKQCGQVIIEILKKLSDEDLCQVLCLKDQNSNFQTGSNSQAGSKDSLLKILKTTINLDLGDTILHSAIVLNRKKLVEEIIKRLINRLSNQELEEVLSCRNKDNKTPLDLAIEKGYEKEINEILEK